jgi:nitrate reductase gamma subunit
MDVWIDWAKGPLFWTALIFMILGLLRHVGLTVWEGVRAYRRAGDKNVPMGQVASDTVKWMIPIKRLRNRWAYSLSTFLFHVGVILVPIFLAGHIELLEAGIGFSWPALPNPVATALTFVVLISVVTVVVQRVAAKDSRALSRFQDYALPLFIAVPFLTGFLVMHPAWNPLSRDPVLLVHALSADLLIFLVPLTKLSHMILLPFTQLVSQLAWHFPQDAGAQVGIALGKENEPI